jgi:hypothetical protein
VDDFTKMGLARPGFMKRNKVWECIGTKKNPGCGELWYEGKPNVKRD